MTKAHVFLLLQTVLEGMGTWPPTLWRWMQWTVLLVASIVGPAWALIHRETASDTLLWIMALAFFASWGGVVYAAIGTQTWKAVPHRFRCSAAAGFSVLGLVILGVGFAPTTGAEALHAVDATSVLMILSVGGIVLAGGGVLALCGLAALFHGIAKDTADTGRKQAEAKWAAMNAHQRMAFIKRYGQGLDTPRNGA